MRVSAIRAWTAQLEWVSTRFGERAGPGDRRINVDISLRGVKRSRAHQVDVAGQAECVQLRVGIAVVLILADGTVFRA